MSYGHLWSFGRLASFERGGAKTVEDSTFYLLLVFCFYIVSHTYISLFDVAIKVILICPPPVYVNLSESLGKRFEDSTEDSVRVYIP